MPQNEVRPFGAPQKVKSGSESRYIPWFKTRIFKDTPIGETGPKCQVVSKRGTPEFRQLSNNV
jgi:hypothetical protein